MINDDNALTFVEYFEKRLQYPESKIGVLFREDYEQFTNTPLGAFETRDLSVSLNSAFYLNDDPIEKLNTLNAWAEEHLSPTARKRFLTAERQKKARGKNELVMIEASKTTRYFVKKSAELAPELQNLKQPELLQLLVFAGVSAIRAVAGAEENGDAWAGQHLLDTVRREMREAVKDKETQDASVI